MQIAFWLPNIVTVIVNIVLFLLVYRLRSHSGAVSGLYMIGGIIGWSLTESFLWIGLSREAMLYLCYIQYLFIITVIFSFLFFVINFTGRGNRLSLRRLRPLFIVPIIILLFIWTNKRHGLFYRSFDLVPFRDGRMFQVKYGPVFLVWAVYAYVLIIWAFVMLIRSHAESNVHYRKQYLAVISGTSIPVVANFLYIFDLYDHQFDITPMAYSGTALFLVWAVYRKRMFDLRPVARREVFSLMSDSILVLDTEERIVDINPPAVKLFGVGEEEALGLRAEELFPDDPVLTAHLKSGGTHTVNLIREGKSCYYSLSHSRIKDKRDYSLGHIIVLRDVTEQKSLEKKLELEAATDSLTGVLNRRYFIELSEKELARSQRNGSPLSLVILDIDHFKSVNDSYGHHTGDRVLKALCAECSRCLRESDLLGRWGGEEFIILLPETELETASLVAERMRKKIMDLRFPVSDDSDGAKILSVSASLGGTAVEPSETDLDKAFKRADEALYRSKQSGRNRLSVG